jgi:hypothetical protein
MHSTTSCDCDNLNCRSQVAEQESKLVCTQSPESPPPSPILKENVSFPVYTQSFLDEENNDDMEYGEGPSAASESVVESEKEKSGELNSNYGPNDSGTDSDSSQTNPVKKREKREELNMEIERKKDEIERYESFFSDKFTVHDTNSNVSIAQFYIQEIEKLSGKV